MTRSLTTALKNELATNDLTPFHLLTINFSTPVNLTDNSFDLTSSISGSSTTYTSSAFLVSVPSFTEETDITKSTLNLELSGASTTFTESFTNGDAVAAIGSGSTVSSGVVANLPAFGNVTTYSGASGNPTAAITSVSGGTITLGVTGPGQSVVGSISSELNIN